MKTIKAAFIVSLLLVGVVIICGCMRPEVPTTVCFSAFYAGDGIVEFVARADPSLMFVWDTGDGGREVGINPTHEYDSYGRYTVTVTATNGARHSSRYTSWIAIDRVSVCFQESDDVIACTYCEWEE